YPQRLMVAEARRMGIEILPVDINRSTTHMRLEELPQPNHSPHRWGIRLALTTVLGLTQQEMRRIERAQPFDSLADIRDRARLSKKSLERLAQLGALDRKSTRLNSSHVSISYAVFCLKKKTRR